jgi:hypothetical protein
VAVAAARIGGDEQLVGLGVALGADVLPPHLDRRDREHRRVVIDADTDKPVVGRDVVHAIGDPVQREHLGGQRVRAFARPPQRRLRVAPGDRIDQPLQLRPYLRVNHVVRPGARAASICAPRGVSRNAASQAPRTVATRFVQRFGGLVDLNVHFHLLIPDAARAAALADEHEASA